MECPIQTKENTEVLLDYCTRNLNAETTAIFERHIEVCAECRAFAEAQRSVWDALDSWDPMPVTADFDKKLFSRIEQYENSSWWIRLWHRRFFQPFSFGPAMPIATACVTLCIAIALYLPGSAPKVDLQTPQTKIESSDIDQLERTLDDIEMLKQLAPPPASRS
jgi:hypothetical protein